MSTTILHVSDTHLGNRQYQSSQRLEDFANSFEQVIQIALGEHPDYDNDPVDAIIHTGDLFESHSIRFDDIHRCNEILQPLSEVDIPFYAIVGNHEIKMKKQFLDLYETNGIAIRLSRDPTIVNGEVALYGIDSVNKQMWSNADFSLTPPEDDSVYRLVCMHQLFSPPIDDDFIADYEFEPVLDRFEMPVDAVALGDYHVRCGTIVRDNVRVFYAGSTERCSRKEMAPRSVDILHIDTEKDTPLQRERYELDTRPFEVIEVEFGQFDNYDFAKRTIEEHTPLTDKVVIVVLSGELVPVTSKQVHAILESNNVAVSRVVDNRTISEFEKDVEKSQTTTVQDIDNALSDALSELKLSRETTHVEGLVREVSGVTTSNITTETSEYLSRQRQERFENKSEDDQ